VSDIARSSDQHREALSLFIERHFPSSTLSDALHFRMDCKIVNFISTLIYGTFSMCPSPALRHFFVQEDAFV